MHGQELAEIGTWTYELGTGLVNADANLKDIFGLSDVGPDAPLTLYLERIHVEDRDRVTATITSALEGDNEGRYQAEYRVIRDRDDVRDVVAKGYLERYTKSSTPVRLQGLVVDVTDRRRAEGALAAEKRVLEMIATGMPEAQTFDFLIRSVEAQSSTGMIISVLLLNNASGKLHHGAAPSLPAGYVGATKGLVIGGRDGSVAHLSRPALVFDIATDPMWAEVQSLAQSHGLSACCSFPIVSSEKRVMGTIIAYYPTPRVPPQHEMQLVETASHLSGIILERSRAEAALQQSAQEFLSIANSIPQLAWMAASTGDILWYNDMWYSYTGITKEQRESSEWRTRSEIDRFSDLIHPQRVFEVLARWQASIDTSEPFEMEIPIRSASGDYRTFLTRAQPIRDEEGRVVRWFGTNTDIEELRLYQQERERLFQEAENSRAQAQELARQLTIERDKLQLTNESLADASRMKSDFLATLSHEIRTPLTGIVGNCELLAQSSLEPGQREFVDTITLCSDSLLAMVSDVLDLAKIEAGKLEMEEAVFSPLKAIEDSVRLTRELAVAKGLGIGLEIESPLPLAVWGDETRLRQVLLNLISNAVKFTTEGTVEVHVASSRDASNLVELRVEVRDTGIGIAPAAQEKLFLPFSQVDASTARRFQGTGLGLAISRELVSKMNGEIGVRSEQGVGSTFFFVIRLPEAERTDEVADVLTLPSKRMRKSLRVLLAEDNPINQKTLQMQMQLQGIDTDCAENGEVALQALEAQDYDLVLMDCHMPVLDGYETTRRLRAGQSRNRNVPVIALTASVIKGERERCLEAGMSDYLSKPIPMTTLSEMLDRWFTPETVSQNG